MVRCECLQITGIIFDAFVIGRLFLASLWFPFHKAQSERFSFQVIFFLSSLFCPHLWRCDSRVKQPVNALLLHYGLSHLPLSTFSFIVQI